jgi:hypothetical protein
MGRIKLSDADMHRIAKVAKETGTVFEVVDGDVTLRFIPVDSAEPEKPTKRINKIDEILNRGSPREAPPPMKPPLNWREDAVMVAFYAFPNQERHDWREIPNFGPDTQQRLLKRGFVEREGDDFWLSVKGRREWKEYTENRGHYF